MKFGVEVRPIRLYTDRLGGTTYTFSNVTDLLEQPAFAGADSGRRQRAQSAA